MSNGAYQIDARPAALDRAIAIVGAAAKLTTSRAEAIHELARRSRTPPSAIRRLLQPSRHPKTIGADFLDRLRGAYLAMLRRQIAALEVETARVAALDDGHAAAQALVAEAEALADRARALL